MELISIIIPTFNSEKYLTETIESVLNQTYPYFEIICVDNGSTDSTHIILEKLAQTDNRIKLFKQPKKGAPAARNLGIEKANGAFIQFLDSDDLLAPEKLERQHSFLSHNNVDIVVSDRIVYDESLTHKLREATFEMIKTDPLLVAIRDIIITGNPLYRKSLFDKHGNWDESLDSAQDWELNMRLALKGARFGYLKGSFLKCRSHGTSLSSNWIKVSRSGINVLEKLRKDLMLSSAVQHSDVQKKIFYCYFDVAVADNESKTINSEMLLWNISAIAQLKGMNRLVAKIFGLSVLIKFRSLIRKK